MESGRNALCPSAVTGDRTQGPIAERLRAEDHTKAQIRADYSKAVRNRWVEAKDVATAALFLASDASSSITADHIKIDCGRK